MKKNNNKQSNVKLNNNSVKNCGKQNVSNKVTDNVKAEDDSHSFELDRNSEHSFELRD